ncbi:uncharacterized protein METZ01_LOCUS350347, partial [marine metagenome]
MSQIKRKTSKQLLWVGIAGISMFFAGLTSAYIVRKAEGNWQEFDMPVWFWYSTITIVISSILLIITKRKIKKNNPILIWVLATFFLGLLFTKFQFNGWQELVSQKIYLTGEGSNVAGSFLYVITLSHLVHLIGGLIALLVTSINAKRGKYSSENYLGLEITSIYW